MKEATKLKIRVVKEGIEKANLTFPVYTLKHIGSLIPENVLTKLEHKKINIKEILENIKSKALTPQTIFQLEEENNLYHVWIE